METETTSEQPRFELLEFEGVQPVGVITSLTGAGQRITRPLGLDHRVILVVEAEVINVNHKTTKDGVKRVHTLSVKDLYEAEGKEGIKLLSNVRLANRKADDERKGIMSLDLETKTDHGLTLDENGTALTPEEAAAAKGDEVADLTAGPEPVVLIFSDKSRAIWPADFVGYQVDEPYAGDFVLNPNSEKSDAMQVIEVLDVVTGEVIEAWTDELEKERLIELEEKLKAEEAAETKAKPKKKAASKKKATPKVIVDEITPALEADAAAEPALPDEEGQA